MKLYEIEGDNNMEKVAPHAGALVETSRMAVSL